MYSMTPLRLTSSRFSSSRAGSDSGPRSGFGGQGAAQGVARFIQREALAARAPSAAESRRSRPGASLAQKLDQFDQVGRPQFQKHHAALEFLGDEADRRGDDDELLPVEAALVDVAQAAPDLGRLAQRLVKILEVEDGGAAVGRDEIQRAARCLRAGFGGLGRRAACLR